MLSAQLPWQQRKASGRSAMPQPTQNHGKCVPGAAAGVIRSIAMSLVQLTQCRNAVSSAQAPLGTRQHLFFPVCEQARCAKGDAVSPSPIVRTTIMKHKAAIAASSVDFDGAAAATTSVSSEGTAGTKAWMSGAFVHICRDFDAWPSKPVGWVGCDSSVGPSRVTTGH